MRKQKAQPSIRLSGRLFPRIDSGALAPLFLSLKVYVDNLYVNKSSFHAQLSAGGPDPPFFEGYKRDAANFPRWTLLFLAAIMASTYFALKPG